MLKNPEQREQYIHRIFIFGILIKGIDGLLEILGSIALLFSDRLSAWIKVMIHGELLEDPHDLMANYLQHHFSLFSVHSVLFGFLYLFSHGIIKILLVIGLLRNKLFAYLSALFIFMLFVVYQLYCYAYSHASYLILLTILDVIVIALTWHEYRIRLGKK